VAGLSRKTRLVAAFDVLHLEFEPAPWLLACVVGGNGFARRAIGASSSAARPVVYRCPQEGQEIIGASIASKGAPHLWQAMIGMANLPRGLSLASGANAIFRY
jgi:hypothetical protein